MRPGTISSLIVVVAASFALGRSAADAQESDRLDSPSQQQEWSEDQQATGQEYEEAVLDSSDTSDSLDGGAEANESFPLSLSIEYTLVSDYIFRGINFSEHATEGRETPNHQLGVSLSLDLATLSGRPEGQYGSIGLSGWFEWYGDQEKISGDGANIQEIDYSASYSYTIEPIATDISVGWIHYYFPNISDVDNDDRTNEWFLSLEHNDAWAWRWLGYEGEDGILNPTIAFYHDMHISGGTWIDVGISHGFEIVENLTVTPSYMLNIDGGYLGPLTRTDDHDTRIAGMTYGVNLTYDLSTALQMPSEAGSMSVAGFINYFDPTSNLRRTIGLEDELWGGMTLSWSW